MRQKLQDMGLNEKEAKIYLHLLTLGNSPASLIAKQAGYPRPTALFILQKLVERGYVSRSYRGNTQYFYTDPDMLESSIKKESEKKETILTDVLPELIAAQNIHSHRSNIRLYQGKEECRQLYETLLTSSGTIREFASHENLTDIHKKYHKNNNEQLRNIHFLSEQNGHIKSVIDIFDEKVIILNLTGEISGIQIEDSSLAQTMSTLHSICKLL